MTISKNTKPQPLGGTLKQNDKEKHKNKAIKKTPKAQQLRGTQEHDGQKEHQKHDKQEKSKPQ